MLKLYRYGQVNSYDLAKVIALIAMIMDHIRYFFLPDNHWLSLIGRISFPIFLFLIGYSQKFNNKKDIWIITIIMMVSSYILNGYNIKIINSFILPTIILTRFILNNSINKIEQNLFQTLLILLFIHPIISIYFMYGTEGCLFAIMGYLLSKKVNNIELKIFALTTITMFIYTEHRVYSLIQIIVFISLMIGFAYFIFNFKIKEFFIPNPYLKNLVLFISRYSLYIYIAHFILFNAIQKIIL